MLILLGAKSRGHGSDKGKQEDALTKFTAGLANSGVHGAKKED